MNSLAPTRRLRFEGSPTRDLPALDALATLVALTLTYVARAMKNPAYDVSWSGVMPDVRHALAFAVAACLLAAAGSGLYGAGARDAGPLSIAAVAAYTTAACALAGTYWATQYPPTIVLIPGFVLLALCLWAVRALYWRAVDAKRT